jgi:hypothetical protein
MLAPALGLLMMLVLAIEAEQCLGIPGALSVFPRLRIHSQHRHPLCM